MPRSRLVVDNETRPEDWTLEAALEQFAAIRKNTGWKKSFGRPYRMLDLVMESVLWTWSVQEARRTGKLSGRQQKRMKRLAGTFTAQWEQMNGLPVLVRSVEHCAALVLAAWAIRVLKNELEGEQNANHSTI